jgi:hypothetical protein
MTARANASLLTYVTRRAREPGRMPPAEPLRARGQEAETTAAPTQATLTRLDSPGSRSGQQVVGIGPSEEFQSRRPKVLTRSWSEFGIQPSLS